MLPDFDVLVAEKIRRASESGRGLAIFDADGTLWADDVGVAFFLWQLKNNELLADQAHSAKRLWAQYNVGELPEREIWIAVAAAQAGLEETTVKEQAKDFFRREFSSRIFLPMKAAIRYLQQRGMEVWVVSASHRWVIEAGAEEFGIPPNRVVAVATSVENGVISETNIEPLPFREGKVRAIERHIGGRVSLVFGDSLNDVPMLEMAVSLAVVINPNKELASLALEKGWAIQFLR